MTQNQIVSVPFNGEFVVAALIDGKPYVPMKPICNNLGLQWESQYNRINRHPVLKSTMVMMTTAADDDKSREMVCLPLSMLNGWLFGVEVSRVKAEIRPKLERYQAECFDVLHQHFMRPQRFSPTTDYEKALDAEKREAASFALAQSGSRAMLMRKGEKKALVRELNLMREVLQLRLALGFRAQQAAA